MQISAKTTASGWFGISIFSHQAGFLSDAFCFCIGDSTQRL